MAAHPTAHTALRRAHPGDAGALALLGAATFLETYALTHKGQDIVAHCVAHHSVETYERWLADPACNLWLAEIGYGATAIGYFVLTPSDLPEAQEGDLELRRLYILHRFQGLGLGRQLIEKATEEASTMGAHRLTIGVFGQNANALNFYQKKGFTQIGTREFLVGEMLCSDYVVAKNL